MKKLLLLCGIVLVLSGCTIKGDFKLGINSDKSIDVSATIAYDDELIEALMSMDEENPSEEIEYTDEQKWEFIDNLFYSEESDSPTSLGFTQERYQEGEFKGYTLAKKINNIDDITSSSANFDLSNDFLQVSESKLFVKDGNNYISKITFGSTEDSQEYQVDSDITFTVTLPNKPISHNADSVSSDGKTLTWNLSMTSQKAIEFEFNFNSFPLIPVIIGAAILLIIIIIIIVIKGKKGPKTALETNIEPQTTANEPVSEIPVQPVTPTLETMVNQAATLTPSQDITPTINEVSEPQQALNSSNTSSTPNQETNLESSIMQDPKTPDQSFLNSSSNTNKVAQSTALSVEDLLNSTPKRDN